MVKGNYGGRVMGLWMFLLSFGLLKERERDEPDAIGRERRRWKEGEGILDFREIVFYMMGLPLFEQNSEDLIWAFKKKKKTWCVSLSGSWCDIFLFNSFNTSYSSIQEIMVGTKLTWYWMIRDQINTIKRLGTKLKYNVKNKNQIFNLS